MPKSTDSVPSPRVVSLLPSATEMVCAVGMEQHLVGVSHECDWPTTVVGRPVLTSSRLSISAASGDIDRSVRKVLEDALAIYQIDGEALGAARPDVIITQDLCDVCAVSFDEVVTAARQFTQEGVQLVNLHPERLADILGDIQRVGQALQVEAAADQCVAELESRFGDVRRRAAEAGVRPHVLTIERTDPVMIGGLWMPELVELAGGIALVTEAGQHAPTLTTEQLVALDPAPDVVLVKPCGFGMDRTVDEAEALLGDLADMPWPAVVHGNLWMADGNAYFNRPGPRIADSLEILAACIHPSLFEDFATRYATGFRRLSVSASGRGA
jgi:iron complex transport system substrate-binding protein